MINLKVINNIFHQFQLVSQETKVKTFLNDYLDINKDLINIFLEHGENTNDNTKDPNAMRNMLNMLFCSFYLPDTIPDTNIKPSTSTKSFLDLEKCIGTESKNSNKIIVNYSITDNDTLNESKIFDYCNNTKSIVSYDRHGKNKNSEFYKSKEPKNIISSYNKKQLLKIITKKLINKTMNTINSEDEEKMRTEINKILSSINITMNFIDFNCNVINHYSFKKSKNDNSLIGTLRCRSETYAKQMVDTIKRFQNFNKDIQIQFQTELQTEGFIDFDLNSIEFCKTTEDDSTNQTTLNKDKNNNNIIQVVLKNALLDENADKIQEIIDMFNGETNSLCNSLLDTHTHNNTDSCTTTAIKCRIPNNPEHPMVYLMSQKEKEEKKQQEKQEKKQQEKEEKKQQEQEEQETSNWWLFLIVIGIFGVYWYAFKKDPKQSTSQVDQQENTDDLHENKNNDDLDKNKNNDDLDKNKNNGDLDKNKNNGDQTVMTR